MGEGYYDAFRVLDRIGEEIQRQRISQAEFCRRAGMKPPLLTQYLNYWKIPGLKQVERIARALDISAAWLLDGGEKERFSAGLSFGKIRKPIKNKKMPDSLTAIRSMLKNKAKKSISLETAFECARYYGLSAEELFFEKQKLFGLDTPVKPEYDGREKPEDDRDFKPSLALPKSLGRGLSEEAEFSWREYKDKWLAPSPGACAPTSPLKGEVTPGFLNKPEDDIKKEPAA